MVYSDIIERICKLWKAWNPLLIWWGHWLNDQKSISLHDKKHCTKTQVGHKIDRSTIDIDDGEEALCINSCFRSVESRKTNFRFLPSRKNFAVEGNAWKPRIPLQKKVRQCRKLFNIENLFQISMVLKSVQKSTPSYV